MAIVHVQDDNAMGSGVSTVSITLNSVGSGNLLWAMTTGDTANRLWTISDDQSNTWNQIHTINDLSMRELQASYAGNVAAGNTQITATINVSSGDVVLVVGEVSGIDTTTPLDTSDEFSRTSNDSTHHCAATTEIDTAADVYVLAGGMHNADPGTLTKGASYTEILNVGSTAWSYLFQYRISASALTNERGSWTSTDDRHCQGIIASFVAAAGGGGTNPKGPLAGIAINGPIRRVV